MCPPIRQPSSDDEDNRLTQVEILDPRTNQIIIQTRPLVRMWDETEVIVLTDNEAVIIDI